jgi:hypothetical protein
MTPDSTGLHKTNPWIRYPTDASPIIIHSGYTIESSDDYERANGILVGCFKPSTDKVGEYVCTQCSPISKTVLLLEGSHTSAVLLIEATCV